MIVGFLSQKEITDRDAQHQEEHHPYSTVNDTYFSVYLD